MSAALSFYTGLGPQDWTVRALPVFQAQRAWEEMLGEEAPLSSLCSVWECFVLTTLCIPSVCSTARPGCSLLSLCHLP